MDNFLNAAVEVHSCEINWKGASGGIEADVSLELCIALHDESNHSIFVEYIVSGYDSTMRAHLTHDGKYKLPTPIPVPTFFVDPSHRIKVMYVPIFALAKGVSKNPRQCKKIDALRLKKYIGY